MAVREQVRNIPMAVREQARNMHMEGRNMTRPVNRDMARRASMVMARITGRTTRQEVISRRIILNGMK